jgi:hypothetical protein
MNIWELEPEINSKKEIEIKEGFVADQIDELNIVVSFQY